MERGTNHEALGKNNTHSCLHLRNAFNLWHDVYRCRNYLKKPIDRHPEMCYNKDTKTERN